MKKISLILFLTPLINLFAQEENDVKLLDAPGNWRSELIQLPLRFAPELDLEGIEDVRFAKGWSEPQSEEFFTYAFLWYLDNDPSISKEVLENSMKVYFDGLMSLIAKGKGIEEIPKTNASFKQIKPEGHTNNYTGSIEFFEAFFTQKVHTLNVKVSSSYCEDEEKHLVFFRFSPKDFEHNVWGKLNEIHYTFECE